MLPPHGGKLVDRVLSPERQEEALEEAHKLVQLKVSDDLAKDTENIAFGAFSPLEGFLNRSEYESVLHEKRLSNDLPWTLPIVLDASQEELKGAKAGDTVAIISPLNEPVALLEIEEIFQYKKEEFAREVYGTNDPAHPGVTKTNSMKDRLVGGKISLIRMSFDEFQKYRLRPIETRVLFKEKGWRTIVGFQTRNIPHIGHEYVQKTALTFVDGLFINPVIGKKKSGDFKDEVILAAYEALLRHYYLRDRTVMAVLRTEMRYAGPREAIFHAIVRKNFGCTHFVVGRDHAGVGKYYPPYAAQEIFDEFPDLGIVPLPFKSFFYCKRCESVVNEKICPHDSSQRLDFSGTDLRSKLSKGEAPPKEFVRPEVAEVLLRCKDPFVE
jgi:sulfate adenylyltransferase